MSCSKKTQNANDIINIYGGSSINAGKHQDDWLDKWVEYARNLPPKEEADEGIFSPDSIPQESVHNTAFLASETPSGFPSINSEQSDQGDEGNLEIYAQMMDKFGTGGYLNDELQDRLDPRPEIMRNYVCANPKKHPTGVYSTTQLRAIEAKIAEKVKHAEMLVEKYKRTLRIKEAVSPAAIFLGGMTSGMVTAAGAIAVPTAPLTGAGLLAVSLPILVFCLWHTSLTPEDIEDEIWKTLREIDQIAGEYGRKGRPYYQHLIK